MAQASTFATTLTAFIRWWMLFILASPNVGEANPAGNVSALQEYSYRLDVGKENALCRHMNAVYNERFRQPWRYNTYDFPPPWYPLLATGQQKPDVRSGLTSRFPASVEFDAIAWKESVMLGSVVTATVLVAEFDIDNDGKNDLVLKRPLMDPWQDGAEDALIVLDLGQVDLSKPIDPKDVYSRPEGLPRPALINYMTLGFLGSWIRPFIHAGRTYLSIHESGHQQSIWIVRYKGGGEKIGRAPPGTRDSYVQDLARPWKPLEIERLCRLRMIPTK